MQEQIQEILRRENLTASQFADRIGVQRSSVSHVISGRNKPGFDFIQKVIMAFPGINADWLILGKGEIYRQIPAAGALFNEEEEKSPDTNASDKKSVTHDEVAPPENIKQKQSTMNKPAIERIIVFYDDRTFREYLKES